MHPLRIIGCLALLVWLGNLAHQAVMMAMKPGAFAGVTYPAWITGTAFVLLAVHFVVNVVRQPATEGALLQVLPATHAGRLRYALFVVTWIAYVGALPYAGFVVSTVVAVAISILSLGRFNPLLLVVLTSLFVVTLKVLFITVFYISLPEGYVDSLIIELVFRLTS